MAVFRVERNTGYTVMSNHHQNKLKGLEAQKTEAENLEIVQLVRAMRLTPQELNAMLSGGGIPGMNAAPATEAADYEEQEDNADEK